MMSLLAGAWVTMKGERLRAFCPRWCLNQNPVLCSPWSLRASAGLSSLWGPKSPAQLGGLGASQGRGLGLMVCGPQGGHWARVYLYVVFALAAPCKDACVLPEGALGQLGCWLEVDPSAELCRQRVAKVVGCSHWRWHTSLSAVSAPRVPCFHSIEGPFAPRAEKRKTKPHTASSAPTRRLCGCDQRLRTTRDCKRETHHQHPPAHGLSHTSKQPPLPASPGCTPISPSCTPQLALSSSEVGSGSVGTPGPVPAVLQRTQCRG